MTDPLTLDQHQSAVQPETAHFAFPVFESVPVGCVPWPVTDARHEPHLHYGEFVVVEVTDRAIVWGEVYLVQQSNGPCLWQVVQAPPLWRAEGKPVPAYLTNLNRPRTPEEVDATWREGGAVHLSDGPIRLEALAPRILGRVIGVCGERAKALN